MRKRGINRRRERLKVGGGWEGMEVLKECREGRQEAWALCFFFH